MPPEPFPWDRKDFFRERRHGHEYRASESLGPSSFSRWRDFRRPPAGYGRQGGWHMFPEDSAYGYAASRSGDRFFEHDGFRSSGPRGEGKYGRTYRENRSSFSQRNWRGHSWAGNSYHHSVPCNVPCRPQDVNDQRQVEHTADDAPKPSSHPHSDTSNTSVPLRSKDQPDKLNDIDGIGTSQRVDKENSLPPIDWKPLKWSRSGSLTSRASGFSNSSSSKSLVGEPGDDKTEVPPKNATPARSSDGDAVACTTMTTTSEETCSRKKPRLGWGEGLAKYEKKKVESPDEHVNKIGNAVSAIAMEPMHSLVSSGSERSPKVVLADCSSPATPSSVGCSSSPGQEAKTFGRAASNAYFDANNLSTSPPAVPHNQLEGFSFQEGSLEHTPIANLSFLLSELLESHEQSSVDSGSAMNALQLLKGGVSKELESTESEIDSLEGELKSLNESGSVRTCPAPSGSVSADLKENLLNGSDLIPRPPPLEVVSSGDIFEKALPSGSNTGEALNDVKVEDIDSPGSATSEFVTSVLLEKPFSPGRQSNACSSDNDVAANTSVVYLDVENTAGPSSCGEGDKLIQGDLGTIADGHNYKEDNLCDGILACNKGSATKASEVFVKLLPTCNYHIENLEAIPASCLQHDLLVAEKFLMRKRHLKFKERVLCLKYRIFRQLWKEDLRLLTIKNCRLKSQKKFDSSLRTLHNGQLKHRSSNRSRFAPPAVNPRLVPTSEIIDFTSKLLSGSQVKMYRKTLNMPALILDERDKLRSRFVSNNGLVEDPCAVEKERSLINPWTPEEKEIFIDKLATLGKDFRKIASFLDHKTAADCVEFYYKNHKSESFDKIRKTPECKKQGKLLSTSTYLVTSGKKWSREMNAASLDMLGAVSAIEARVDEQMERGRTSMRRYSEKKSRGANGIFETASSFDIDEDEKETLAADVLAGICGSLSSEAMSSCITTSVDHVEGNRERKAQKIGSSVRCPLTPEVSLDVDDDASSDESCGEMDPVDWTDEEKSAFLQAFSSYGRDFDMISRFLQTKSRDQCKVFFSKARKCLGLDMIHPEAGNEGMPASDDASGGGSGTEDACVMETGSVVCSDKSGSRMDEDISNLEATVILTGKNASEDSCQEQTGDGDYGSYGKTVITLERSLPGDQPAEDVSARAICNDGVVANKENAESLKSNQENEDHSDSLGCEPQPVIGHDISMGQAAVDEVGLGRGPVDSNAYAEPEAQTQVADETTSSESQNRDESNIDLEVSRDESCREPRSPLSFNRSLSGEPESDRSKSSILSGYSLDLSVEPDNNIQSLQSSSLRKCTRLVCQNPVPELPLLAKAGVNMEDNDEQCSSKTEKVCGNGNVKLFGQILSKPSSLVDRPNSDKGLECHDSGVKLDMKLSVSHNVNGNLNPTKYDHSSSLKLEDVPLKSYGFWDGTKIQTGYFSLPDSARLLAKYPDAFTNYSTTSPKIEQHPLPATGSAVMNGALCLSPHDFSSSTLAGYRVQTNQDTTLQPFDMHPEMQRNGTEPLGRDLIKVNVVQGGEFLVGSSCTDVCDAVSALELHYSGTQQYGAQAGNFVREEEPWREQQEGDLGR